MTAWATRVNFSEIRLVLSRKKWFLNKAPSVTEQPWVLLCLAKDSAQVKKTDSCSLSTWLSVMSVIIYLVAAMTTLWAAWCMEFLRARSNDSQMAFHQEESRCETRRGNNGRAGTCALFWRAFHQEIINKKRRRKRDSLQFASCCRTPCINSW